MKTLFLILLPIFGFAQPKFQTIIDGGLTHSFTATSRAGAQLTIKDYVVFDAGFRYTSSGGVNYFTESATAGISKDFQQIRLMVTGGAYFHQLTTVDKTERGNKIGFGGQVILQRGVGICGLEWNGVYATGFVGIALFNPKAPTICDYH